MKIINKKSPEVEALRSRGKSSNKLATVTLSRREVYFSKYFVVTHKLKAGQFVNFLNEGDDWRFYISSDKDGFELQTMNRSRQGLVIGDAALLQLMLKTMGLALGKYRFEVVKTKTTQEGYPVYWILNKKQL